MQGDVLGLKLAGVLTTSAVFAAELVGSSSSTSLSIQFVNLVSGFALACVFSGIGLYLMFKFDPSFRGHDNSQPLNDNL
jgi:hypothetical protein